MHRSRIRSRSAPERRSNASPRLTSESLLLVPDWSLRIRLCAQVAAADVPPRAVPNARVAGLICWSSATVLRYVRCLFQRSYPHLDIFDLDGVLRMIQD